jgi:hypothetical protein
METVNQEDPAGKRMGDGPLKQSIKGKRRAVINETGRGGRKIHTVNLCYPGTTVVHCTLPEIFR